MGRIPARPDFLTLWGIVRGAVERPDLHGNRNQVTSYIYRAYRDLYAARGDPAPRLTPLDLNPVLARAYEQRGAKRELGRAVSQYRRVGVDTALTPRMRAADVDA